MNAVLESSTETLGIYITDMIAAEHHLLQNIKAVETDDELENFPEIRSQLVRIRLQSESHVAALKILLCQLGEDSSHIKEIVTSVTGTALGVVSKIRRHSIAKALRDIYTALSLNAIGYEMLHTTGLALSSKPTADAALQHLTATAGFLREVSWGAIPVVVTELAENNPVKPSVADAARSNIRTAWLSWMQQEV
jgi:hypothetical protein